MRAYSTPSLGTIGAIALVTLPATFGCSSSSPAASGGTSSGASSGMSSGASSGSGDAAAASELNPDGVPYPKPAGGYGHTARTGSAPGSVIQDFTFQGYPNADKSNGLQTISLADYYDPCGKRLKLLHLTAAGVWCVPCGEETDSLVTAKAQLASEGVVVIQALGDGANEGTPATLTDLDNWIGKHMSNFTEMLDPGFANLGVFFNTATVPFNCDIDPRTMEILDEGTGWSGDLSAELQPALGALSAAPSFPIPAVCGDQ
jgi:hypothetical protein